MKLVAKSIILALLALTTACNTIEGAGRDLSSVGDTVAGTADRSK